jgi:ABC-type multidrug transport system ATPase subunit
MRGIDHRTTPGNPPHRRLKQILPGVKALDNVDFSLRRGEIMALLGKRRGKIDAD